MQYLHPRVLNILEEFLTVLGYKYLRMDGSTPVLDRQMLIDEYNTNRQEIFVFLLSTRAAGLGINLTSADVCIFHDIDWNPEMDRQVMSTNFPLMKKGRSSCPQNWTDEGSRNYQNIG